MDDRKVRLIAEGNAFYEIDLECLKRKREGEQRKEQREVHGKDDPQKDSGRAGAD